MIKSIRILFFLYFFFIVGNFALAQIPAGSPVTLTEVEGLVARIATFLIIVSTLVAVASIVWAGISYMTAGSDSTKITEAQDKLKSGLIGAAIVMGVGVILQTVYSVVTRDFFCRVRIPIIGTCIIQ